MENTKIEWCDHSWSPWRGCTKVSAGCANCYAETLSKRNPAVLGQWGKGKPRVKAKNWNEPRKWDREAADAVLCPNRCSALSDLATGMCLGCGADMQPACPTVFPSLCDWLDDEVPVEWLAEFLQLVHDTPNLTWLLLTKRPENWPLLRMALTHVLASPDNASFTNQFTFWLQDWCDGHPPKNVWLGTSVEDQPNADRRIPALLKIPAAVRFVSLEPLLGPVRLTVHSNVARGHRWMGNPEATAGIDWLIIGGESGKGSRPCNVEWIRSLVAQGKAAGVPTFVKQFGANPVDYEYGIPIETQKDPMTPGEKRIRHTKGGDPAEWPADLRVREFPQWGR